jgi:hypothetical protein
MQCRDDTERRVKFLAFELMCVLLYVYSRDKIFKSFSFQLKDPGTWIRKDCIYFQKLEIRRPKAQEIQSLTFEPSPLDWEAFLMG